MVNINDIDRYLIRNAVHLRRMHVLTHIQFNPPVYFHLSHNGLYLCEILYTIDIWTAVCVFEMYETEEVKRAQESALLSDSAYHTFTNFKLIDNILWLPGKNGTSGQPVPITSGAEAIVSDR